jgi:hypothetical protein
MYGRQFLWHSGACISETVMTSGVTLLSLTLMAVVYCGSANAQVPATIAAPGEATVATFHAEGAQIYECKSGSDGKLDWAFREPVAALFLNHKTVGRHYAGPTWEDVDGSAVTGKVLGNAPGATANDIPWLKLNVESKRGSGVLAEVNIVQRIKTRGGVAKGPCNQPGTFRSVPYSAEYVFLRKGG